MAKPTADVVEALVANRSWYEVLCATRDYMAEHHTSSRWPRLHKELIRGLTRDNFLQVVREHIQIIPASKEK